jgi:hypothetical protein
VDPTSSLPTGQAQHIQQAFEEVRKWSSFDIISSFVLFVFEDVSFSQRGFVYCRPHAHVSARASDVSRKGGSHRHAASHRRSRRVLGRVKTGFCAIIIVFFDKDCFFV